jgi:CDP-glucose 4,6-dehydratase
MDYPLGHRLRELPGPLLLTGHTGFKGTWMTFLLEHLNVSVVGYALPAEKDSLYDRADRTGVIPEAFGDVRDYESLEEFIDLNKPSTIIHMAAQPIVLKSYESPRETFDVNVMGTVNVLDIAFKKDFVKAIIVVTTDKVYRNDNSGRAFIESDPLEGKDPYSASKVGTESVVAAWQQIAKVSGGPKVVSVRAGNVIGGGDFAENRIIPDLIRGVMSGAVVEIRNPHSTRPWQHVLDPLCGYLNVIENCLQGKEYSNFNFGPISDNLSVGELTQIAKSFFKDLKLNNIQNPSHLNFETTPLDIESIYRLQEAPIGRKEAESLQIDTKRAILLLDWFPRWTQLEAVSASMDWWNSVLFKSVPIIEACMVDLANIVGTSHENTSTLRGKYPW